MRPAAGFGDPAAGEQFIEPGISVGVDDAAQLPQMRLRMLTFAARRVEEQRRLSRLLGAYRPRPDKPQLSERVKGRGRDGDRINAAHAAVGYNFSLLLRWLARLLRALMSDTARSLSASPNA